jgi:hypothetical protein
MNLGGLERVTTDRPGVAGDWVVIGVVLIHMVKEVVVASVAVDIPENDGILGRGIHATLPTPKHTHPLKTLHEQQPHLTVTAT